MKKSYISFLPWIILFAIGSDNISITQAAVTAAMVCALFVNISYLKKMYVMAWVTVLYFIFLFLMLVILKQEYFLQYIWLTSNIALALVAFISLAIRKPFTLQYSRETVSAEKHSHPLFLKINDLVTLAWGISFLCGVIISTIGIHYEITTNYYYQLVTYIPSLFAALFTVEFPKWYSRRHKSSGSA